MQRLLIGLAVVASTSCSRSETPMPQASQSGPDATPAKLDATPKPKTPPPPDPKGPPVRRDGTMFGTSELMGTTVSLNVYVGEDGNAAGAGKAMQEALAEMARIETLMSEWKPDTELSRLNDAAGRPPLAVSDELFEVLEVARRVHRESEGAFDVTFHGVGHLWSFEAGATPPSRAAVKAALHLVDGTGVELDPETKSVRLPQAGMKIGLGAIAKGYAVDRASALLQARGFSDHVVEAGGDTYAAGSKGGQPWRVGVQDPKNAGSLGVLSVRDRAVVTSGDYMRFFEHEGRRYTHILDPKTGWPVEADESPRSVTLLAGDATRADAYCTAVTVMGPRRGLAFVESRPDLDAVIIERDGTVRVSSGLSEIYEALPPSQPEP